jgi:hypothetical protein
MRALLSRDDHHIRVIYRLTRSEPESCDCPATPRDIEVLAAYRTDNDEDIDLTDGEIEDLIVKARAL